MIWFAQTVQFEENIRIVGFLNTIATTTFNDGLYVVRVRDLSRSGTRCHVSMACRILHTILSLRVKKIGPALQRVRQKF